MLNEKNMIRDLDDAQTGRGGTSNTHLVSALRDFEMQCHKL